MYNSVCNWVLGHCWAYKLLTWNTSWNFNALYFKFHASLKLFNQSYSIRRSSSQVNTMGQKTKQCKHPIITTSQLYGQLSHSRHGHSV